MSDRHKGAHPCIEHIDAGEKVLGKCNRRYLARAQAAERVFQRANLAHLRHVAPPRQLVDMPKLRSLPCPQCRHRSTHVHDSHDSHDSTESPRQSADGPVAAGHVAHTKQERMIGHGTMSRRNILDGVAHTSRSCESP